MGETTGIAWCDHTHNIVWGCAEKFETVDDIESMDPACRNCYARAFAKRVGQDVWGPDKPRRVFGDDYWRAPLRWDKAAERYPDQCLKCSARLCMAAQRQSGTHVCPSQRDERGKFDPSVPACGGEVALNVRPRVFCSSMADVFEDHPEVARQRERLWPLIDKTPHVDWLLLTKRPENMLAFAPEAWRERWPANVWPGTTVANQDLANLRIPLLQRVPARVRFLSVEPMLERIMLEDDDGASWLTGEIAEECHWHGIDWVICGGESGGKARPFDLDWARSLRDQCASAGVPYFMKQMGEKWAHESGTWHDDSHGGSPAFWPEDLRVRQFPEAA